MFQDEVADGRLQRLQQFGILYEKLLGIVYNKTDANN